LIGFVSILATPLPLRPAYLIGQIASNAVVHGTNEVKAVRESRQAAIAAQAATPPAVAATAAAAGQPAPAPRAIYVVPPTKSA
jgi:hypothetical protein